MGTMQRVIESKRSKRNERRYQARAESVQVVTWSEVSEKKMVETIDQVAAAGGALRFGYTRGGGVLSLGVYGDGDEPYTLFAQDAAEMENHLDGLATVFEAIAAEKAQEKR